MNVKKMAQFSIGPIGAAGLGLVIIPFIAWFFSVEDVGRLTMLQVVLSLSGALFSLAMHQSYVREYNEVEDKQLLFKTSITPGLIFLGITIVFIAILPVSISYLLFGIDSIFLTCMLMISVFSTFLIIFFEHVLRMQERGLAFSATQVVPKSIFLVLIGAILILNLKPSFVLLMLLNTVAVFFSLVIFAIFTRDTWWKLISKKIDVLFLKHMLSFSLPLVFGGLAYWGLTAMDRFFLRALAGFEELAVYALAVAIAGAVSVISSIFSNLWHPILYKWLKEGVEPMKVQGVIENMLLVVTIIWSMVGLFSWILPNFLPSEYKSIEYLIVACVAMPLFYMLSETTVVGINITRRTNFSMLASVAAFIVNAILNYLLIPDFGASGAAIASVLSFFIFFAVRTESSAWLWNSLPRLKVYITTIFYMLATITMVFTESKIVNYSLIWLGLLIFSVLMFNARIKEAAKYFKTFMHLRT